MRDRERALCEPPLDPGASSLSYGRKAAARLVTMRRTAALVLSACGLASLAAQTPNTGFDQFVERYSDEWMRFHTNAASTRRYFKSPEQDALERQIEPVTKSHRDAEQQLIQRGLTELGRFDRAGLTAAQQRSADIIAWDLTTQKDAAAFADDYYPFAQNYGADASLISLLTVSHTVRTVRDADSYLARLSLVAERMDEATAEGRRLAAARRLPPKFILQTTAAQMRGFLDMPAASNPFVTAFAEKLAAVAELPPAQRESLRASAERVTSAEIYPAWRRALSLLETQIPRATDDAGLWRFPRGADAYRQALQRFTTTTLTPDQIHQTGLRMVTEIEARMDTVLRDSGYTEGPLRARMAKVVAEQPKFPSTADGRAQYNAMITGIISDAERRAASLFERLPTMRVVARPYPDFMPGRAASYQMGTTDGARPGVYQYSVTGIPLSRFSVRTTAYHEAIPGHHFQGALQAEDASLPRFLQNRVFGNNSAIGEGWGLYAERLVAEQGWYDGDPIGLLGQLDMALFRARRLVIDTGLHEKRWTRQQAVDYLGPLSGLGTESEIDRYVVQPGQACSYMIGELKIVELREKAKTALGGRFMLGEFHNRVLGAGRVPLSVLEGDIDRWIAEKEELSTEAFLRRSHTWNESVVRPYLT